MKGRYLTLFLFIFLYQACNRDNHCYDYNQDEKLNKQIKLFIQESDDMNISAQDLPENIQKELLYRLKNIEGRIDQIEKIVNQGCFHLVNDISAGKINGVHKQILENYPELNWESRNIGFKNWISSVRGAFLLQKADNLKAQILLMKLIDKKDLSPLIDKKTKVYMRLIDKLAVLADQASWAE